MKKFLTYSVCLIACLALIGCSDSNGRQTAIDTYKAACPNAIILTNTFGETDCFLAKNGTNVYIIKHNIVGSIWKIEEVHQ